MPAANLNGVLRCLACGMDAVILGQESDRQLVERANSSSVSSQSDRFQNNGHNLEFEVVPVEIYSSTPLRDVQRIYGQAPGRVAPAPGASPAEPGEELPPPTP